VSVKTAIFEAGIPARLRAAVNGVSASRLTQNFGWYMVGELAVRVSRLLVTIVLARWLVPADFGVAAIVITTYELIRVLAANGSSAFMVRASADTYDAVCMAMRRLGFALALGLIALQAAAGAVIAALSGRPEIFSMLAVLALAHLAVPLTDIHYARLQLQNRLKALAAVTSTQVLLDGVLAAVFALAGFGAWSIVLPRLLTTPVYVAMLWRASPEPLPSSVASASLVEFWSFSLPFLGSELLAALRVNADKILVGALLGVETLGVYTFAFNAGLGITLTLTAALSASLFPHFSETVRSGGDVRAKFDAALRRMVLPISLLILLQAAAALIYVPILFGERWAFAAPIVALICLSAALRPLYDASCQLLRATGDTRRELIGAATFTAILLSCFAAGLAGGLMMALGVLVGVSVLGHLAFTIWALRSAQCSPQSL
jgi:O-antigen/teichoic acid export membrane protein